MADAHAATAPIVGASFASGPAAAGEARASAPIPFRPAAADEPGGASIAGALLLCAVALAVAAIVLRRRVGGAGRPHGQRLVEVVESARVADRMRVSVIRYRGRELLVAHSDQAIAVLDGAAPPATPGTSS